MSVYQSSSCLYNRIRLQKRVDEGLPGVGLTAPKSGRFGLEIEKTEHSLRA